MRILIELYISPAPPRISKISKICPDRDPREPNLALEQRNGPNPNDQSLGMPMGAHNTATEDKCDSSWAYLSSYIYHQPLPESQKSRKSAQIATPGSQNLALEQRNGPNPNDQSIGMPMGAHKTATEDKCDSSWVYLSSY